MDSIINMFKQSQGKFASVKRYPTKLKSGQKKNRRAYCYKTRKYCKVRYPAGHPQAGKCMTGPDGKKIMGRSKKRKLSFKPYKTKLVCRKFMKDELGNMKCVLKGQVHKRKMKTCKRSKSRRSCRRSRRSRKCKRSKKSKRSRKCKRSCKRSHKRSYRKRSKRCSR